MRLLSKILCLIVLSTTFTSCDWISGLFSGDIHNHDTEQAEAFIQSEPSDTTQSEQDANKTDSVNQAAQAAASKMIEEKSKQLEDILHSQNDSITSLNAKMANLDEKLENNSDGKIDKKSAYTFMIIEFLLLACIIAYLYNKLNNRLSRHRNEIEGLKNNQRTNVQPVSSNNSQTKDIRELRTSLNLMTTKVKALEKKIKELAQNKTQTAAEQIVSHPEISQEQKQQESTPQSSKVFYMPRTARDRTFDVANKKLIKDETTYFRFEIKKDGKAEFYFDAYSTQAIRKSFDDRDNSIATVCEIVNAPQNPSDCKTITPGEAELRNNIWYVTTKARIAYV